ncbi:MAG TPA: RIP metalloprotease RseP [Micropepsaceae bacterium]|jgi:regulator of sigma E protease
MPAVVADFVSWMGVGLPAFLFVITLVVFVHELGHFLVARWCGVTVETFSIGFGREIVGFNDSKGTRWKLSWIPLGGYVRFFGDADASSRPDREKLKSIGALDGIGKRVEFVKDPQSGVLHFKPLYQRALVAAAGPIANFILAIVIFASLILTVGKPAEPPIVEAVMAGSAAEMAGMQSGDTIRSVDGQAIRAFIDLQRTVGANAGKTLRVVVNRGGRDVALDVVPTATEITDASGAKHSQGRLGIRDATVSVGIVEAIGGGLDQTWFIVSQTGSYLGKIVTGRESPDQLHGILGIGAVSDQAARIGFAALIGLAGLMSVSIGLVNLLPIPVLDGGHLLYYAFEAVLGRPLGERAQEVGFRLGLAFVLCLMLLATFNDLVRLNLF